MIKRKIMWLFVGLFGFASLLAGVIVGIILMVQDLLFNTRISWDATVQVLACLIIGSALLELGIWRLKKIGGVWEDPEP